MYTKEQTIRLGNSTVEDLENPYILNDIIKLFDKEDKE